MVVVSTQPLLHAATVNITMFSASNQIVSPNAQLQISGDATWTGAVVNEVAVRIRHNNSGILTNSASYGVSYTPPATSGTWSTGTSGPLALTASSVHTAGDQYNLEVEGFNTAIGPFTPPATDSDLFFIF